MIRTKGEPGTGDVVQAVRHMRMMNQEIAKITSMREDELYDEAKNLQVPYNLVQYVHDLSLIHIYRDTVLFSGPERTEDKRLQSVYCLSLIHI